MIDDLVKGVFYFCDIDDPGVLRMLVAQWMPADFIELAEPSSFKVNSDIMLSCLDAIIACIIRRSL